MRLPAQAASLCVAVTGDPCAGNHLKWRCNPCNTRGTTLDRPAGPCSGCGAPLQIEREEAILDIEAQAPGCPRLFADVTVRYAVPADAEHLAAAA